MTISNREERQQIRDTATQYGLTRFTVYVFAAGVSSMLVMLGATFYFDTFPIENTRIVQGGAVLISAYGLFPLFASYLFTINHPEKRIIPPFFIQLVAASLLMAFVVLYTGSSQIRVIAFVGAVMSAMVSYFTDEAIIRLLGRFVDRRDLETRELAIEGDTLENLEQTLLENAMRIMLHLRSESENTEHGIVLRTNGDSDYNCYIELSVNPLNRDIRMTMVFFEQGRYFTKTSDALLEYADRTVGYLIWRLMSLNRIVTASRERSADDEHTRQVEERAVDTLRGMLDPGRRITRRERISTLVAALSFVVPAAAIIIEGGITNNTLGYVLAAVGIYATILTIDTSLSRRRHNIANQ